MTDSSLNAVASRREEGKLRTIQVNSGSRSSQAVLMSPSPAGWSEESERRAPAVCLPEEGGGVTPSVRDLDSEIGS